MSEYITIWQVTVAGIGCVMASCLYSLGGRRHKIIRRLGASAVLALTLNLVCLWRGVWSPWLLSILPVFVGAFSLGYGADYLHEKIIKRLIYFGAVVFSGAIVAVILGSGAWFVFIPHVGIGLWSVYLGTKNPLEAPAEEFFICIILNVGLLMYSFVS